MSLSIMGLFFFLVAGVISVGGLLFWIWMLVDCAVNETNQGNEKLVWIAILLFANLLGAVLYFLVRRPRRHMELGK